jgi:SAM-dependent methyltransferase
MMTLLARVRAPSLEANLRVLELGCGQGLSANILAACNPCLDYTAVDFNPAHIANAQALARQARTSNITFREASFEDVAEDAGYGQFDVIALHGVYTWVSKRNRQIIVRIVREKLKAGGLVYLSYNTHPGWSAFEPVRRLFVDRAAASPAEPMFERLESGFQLCDELSKLGARALSPALRARLQRVRTQSKNYLAHELLNNEWTLFHFSDVAADMARAKLSFVGSAHALDYIDGLNLTPAQINFLKQQKDPVRREGLRDFIVNQGFRRDIFVKGPVGLTAAQADSALLETPFLLSVRPSEVGSQVKGVLGEAKLPAAIFEPLSALLADGPVTGEEILRNATMSKLGWSRIREALVVLIGRGVCHPVPEHTAVEASEYQVLGLNSAILRQARESANIAFLASSRIGGGVPVDRISQLFLLAGQENSPAIPHRVWEWLKAANQRLTIEGKTLEDDKENLAELERRFATFKTTREPQFSRLGIF